jgi:hypothetical protein
MDSVTAFLQTHPWVGVILSGLGGIAVTVLGQAVWPFLQHQSGKRAHALNAAKVIADLQRELNDKLVRLMDLSKKYADLRDAEAASGPTREHQERGNEMRRLTAQIDLLKTEIPDSEGRLAKLEGRPARPIQVHWIRPSPPTGLRIISVEEQSP